MHFRRTTMRLWAISRASETFLDDENILCPWAFGRKLQAPERASVEAAAESPFACRNGTDDSRRQGVVENACSYHLGISECGGKNPRMKIRTDRVVRLLPVLLIRPFVAMVATFTRKKKRGHKKLPSKLIPSKAALHEMTPAHRGPGHGVSDGKIVASEPMGPRPSRIAGAAQEGVEETVNLKGPILMPVNDGTASR